MTSRCLILAALLGVSGCAGRAGVRLPEVGLTLPATFVGVLPCADCPSIHYQLNLMPDNTFYMRMTYLERPDAGDLDDVGTWVESSDGATIVLDQGEMFAIKSPQRLRKLDLEGGEIVSSLPYDLTRAESFAAFEPQRVLRGMYTYLADAGTFSECRTGRRFPVAMEADNAALEREYAQARSAPGEAVLAEVEGRLAARPRREGAGTEETLVVVRFVGLEPRGECSARFAAAPLEGTTWHLATLGERTVTASSSPQRAGLVLDGENHRVSGSGGCNRIMGTYTRDGEHIGFSPMAATRMACPDGMDLEQAYTAMLELVTSWRVLGRTMELRDVDGRRLASFQVDAPK